MPINIPDSFESIGDAVVIGGTGGAGRTTFVSLNDTPSSYSGEAGKLAAVNVGETALEFINPPSGTFLGLTDVTSTTYTGQAGNLVVVNSGETGLEFAAGAATNEVLKQGLSGPEFGFIAGQTLGSIYFRSATVATRSIATAVGMESSAPLNFKASSSSVEIFAQVYCEVATGDTLYMGISDDSVTFSEVDATSATFQEVYDNGGSGSHPLTQVVTATWEVTGLTAGTPYTWYLGLRRVGSGSTNYQTGPGRPYFILKALAK
jgi:hypothetical protein